LDDALGKDARSFEVPLGPEALWPALDRILGHVDRPAAFIFARARHAAGALGHFAIRRHMDVPNDVALISLNDDPFLRFIQPPIACYQRDTPAIARQLSALVVRVATGPGLRPRMKLLMPEFVRGETVPLKGTRGKVVTRSDQSPRSVHRYQAGTE
jgi:DNA-binding LacI/PurR family transcriptional regulator